MPVQLTECLGRDGLQSLDRVFSTAEKVELLRGFADAGFQRIEVTSYVPPKYFPQFYDPDEVIAALRPETDANLIAFVPNARGMERAADALAAGHGPDTALIVVSASEAHNQRNLKRAKSDTMADHRRAAEVAHTAGLRILGSISTSFGCPYTGDVPLDDVVELVHHYREIGAHELQFGDTTGTANPVQVRRFFERVLPEMGDMVPVAHFHDTRGAAIVNSLTAIDLGIEIVDTSLGGLGGRPPSQRIQYSGPTGNTSTEDLAALLAEMGVETGLDPAKVLALGRRLEQIMQQPLHSHITHAGLVPHGTAEEAEQAPRMVAVG